VHFNNLSTKITVISVFSTTTYTNISFCGNCSQLFQIKKTSFSGDSNRPGYIAGPYIDTQAFVDEYEQYRGRKIVAFRELESYKKQRKSKKLRKSQFSSWNNVYPHHNFAIP
jgi:hypothetical protein